MTGEECRSAREAAIGTIPLIEDMALMPGATTDGWCRLRSAPFDVLDGAEWIAEETAEGFRAQVRQSEVEIDGFGAFAGFVAFEYDRTAKALSVSALELARPDGDDLRVSGQVDGVDLASHQSLINGLSGVSLSELTVQISGRSGLVGEVLADLFLLDRAAASSNFTTASDQRDMMTARLEQLPTGLGGAASRDALARMIRAYPAARGTAEFSIAEGHSLDVSHVLRYLILGEVPTEMSLSTELEKAGLTFRWID